MRRLWRGRAATSELRALLERFLGPDQARRTLQQFASGKDIAPDADPELVHHVETVLAGAVGTASARVLVESVVAEETLGLEEVMEILDEASQVREYSRRLEQKSRELEAATAELREANQRLTELDRLKDDFVSTVSHELRTPLTSIRAFSEILLDNRDLGADERERFLRVVVEETERLTRLITQILDLSKLESGTFEWVISEVDIGELVSNSVAATTQLFEQRGIRLAVHVSAAVPAVLADRDRVIQVLMNLLSNAAKFTESEAGVDVHVQDSVVRVDVSDNGPGVLAEHRGIIFERFRQGGDVAAKGRREPVWGCRSAGRSSNISGARSGWTARPAAAPPSPSRCHCRRTAHDR